MADGFNEPCERCGDPARLCEACADAAFLDAFEASMAPMYCPCCNAIDPPHARGCRSQLTLPASADDAEEATPTVLKSATNPTEPKEKTGEM